MFLEDRLAQVRMSSASDFDMKAANKAREVMCTQHKGWSIVVSRARLHPQEARH